MANSKDPFDYARYDSVRNIVEELIAEWKSKGEISGGISRLSYNEAGVPLVEGIAVAVKENTSSATDAMSKAMDEIKIKLNTGAVSTREYYKYMELYRDNFLEKGSLEWWKYTEKIMDYETSLNEDLKKELETRKDNIVSVYTDILSDAGTAISELSKLQDKTYKNLTSYTNKFMGGTVTFKNAGKSFLKDGIWHTDRDLTYNSYSADDLQKASDALNTYYSLLSEIKNKSGVPEEFFSMLRSMPVEDAVNLSTTLLSGSETDFYSYIESWQNLNRTVNNTVDALLSDDVNNFLKSFSDIGTNLKNDLAEALGQLPNDFFINGELSGDAFSKGFLSKLSLVTSTIENLENRYNSLGDSVTYNNSSYNFYSSGETVSQQLETARNLDTLNRLRE